MRNRLAAVALALPLVLAGCSGESTTASSTASAAPVKTRTPQQTAQPQSWERVPADRRRSYMAALERIDPGLAVKESRAVSRGMNVCLSVWAGGSEAQVLKGTALRFDGGNASVPVGSEKARRILAAVKRWICSDVALKRHYEPLLK